MTLQVKQRAHYEGKEWWSWSVWLEGTSAELKAIDHVVYTLHATFPDPVRKVKTRRNGFRLDSEGWGEFLIFLKIVRGDGKSVKRTHWLELAYPRDKEPALRKLSSATKSKVKSKVGETGRADLKPPAVSAPRNVYISSGAADAEFARKLREQLSERGLKVSSPESVVAGSSFAEGIQKAIEGADAAVFVLSGEPSLWSNFEIDYAKAGKTKTMIPVLVGKSTKIPPSLTQAKAIRVASDRDVGFAASGILKAAGVLLK